MTIYNKHIHDYAIVALALAAVTLGVVAIVVASNSNRTITSYLHNHCELVSDSQGVNYWYECPTTERPAKTATAAPYAPLPGVYSMVEAIHANN